MNEALTVDDPRYYEMFNASHEAAARGEVVGDMSPQMNALRKIAPVHKGSLRELMGYPDHHTFDVERGHYTLTSFKTCDQGFRDNALYSSTVYHEMPLVRAFGDSILWKVGDDHRRYRAVAQPMFIRPKAMNWWKQNWIEEIVNGLLDKMEGNHKADLNIDLCARLPMHVVTRGIGMSGAAALDFRDHLLRATGVRTSTDQERVHSMGEVVRMLNELIVERRACPADDVVSGLITRDFETADGGSRKLEDEEIFSYCRLIMFAGGGTTWRQLGITIHAMLTHGDFWREASENRDLIPAAIDESLRWLPTDPVFPRLAMHDVEVEGVSIPAGARVDLCLGAANRDPTRWEDPDRYDIHRPSQYHLGVGVGVHQCLGQNVARQEMVSAITGLMDRFPNLSLDTSAETPRLVGGIEARGMSSLPVRLV